MKQIPEQFPTESILNNEQKQALNKVDQQLKISSDDDYKNIEIEIQEVSPSKSKTKIILLKLNI